jgi:DNA-binding NtrC family response regulator
MTSNTGIRVFVIDDDVSVAEVVSAVLHQAGFEVSTFNNALSAARHARRASPHVVVTDYSMPDINGLALAAWLQTNCPECKIVILTGEAAAVAEHAGVELRFTLLEKPVAPQDLIGAVQELMPANRKSHGISASASSQEGTTQHQQPGNA